jgi:hypothetical protein
VAAPLALAPHPRPRPGGPIDALTIAIVVAVVFGQCAGIFFGLWWGEKGRRRAAERLASTGDPSAPRAARLPDEVDGEGVARTMGRAAAEAAFSAATITKGIEQLQREAASAGRPLSAEDARQQVIAMLAGNEVTPDLTELGIG